VLELEDSRVKVIGPNRLETGQVHHMRIELEGGLHTLDIAFQVGRIETGNEYLLAKRWIHDATYRKLDASDSLRLDRWLGELPDGQRRHDPDGSPDTGYSAEPISTDTSGLARRSGTARLARAVARARIRDGAHSVSTDQSNQDRRRDLLQRFQKNARTRKGVPETQLVTPLFVPGPPIGVLAIFPSYQALAKALDLNEDGVCVVLGGSAQLEVGDVVGLVLELPDKTQIELMTMVGRKGQERDYLQANFVEPSVLAMLRSLG
jgi:hypothetical protein